MVRGDEGARLRQDGDERRLPQQGRLPGHVGPRDDVQARVGREGDGVGREDAAVGEEAELDGRVAAVDDVERVAVRGCQNMSTSGMSGSARRTRLSGSV